jgi:hypothetical protein
MGIKHGAWYSLLTMISTSMTRWFPMNRALARENDFFIIEIVFLNEKRKKKHIGNTTSDNFNYDDSVTKYRFDLRVNVTQESVKIKTKQDIKPTPL